MLLEWVEPGGAGTHCGLGPFFGHYPLIFYPLPVNYNDFPPWPLRTGVIPSPVWALWIIPSDPSRWFFPRVCVVAANSCLTLCDPLNCSLQAPLSMGILQARILEWVAVPFSRGFFPYPQVIFSLTWTQLKTWGGPSADLWSSLCIPLLLWYSAVWSLAVMTFQD